MTHAHSSARPQSFRPASPLVGVVIGLALQAATVFAACPNSPIFSTSTNNTNGWALVNAIQVSLGSQWVINPGSDPQVVSPALTCAASSFNYMRLGMTNHGTDTRGRVYFDNGSGYSETRSVGFTNPTNPSRMPWISVRLDNISGWSGTISALRVDPVVSGSGGSDNVDLGYFFWRYDDAPPYFRSITVTPSTWTSGAITLAIGGQDPHPVGFTTGPDVYGSGCTGFNIKFPWVGSFVYYPRDFFDDYDGRAARTFVFSPGAIPTGEHVVEIQAVDLVGRVSGISTATLRYDGVAPSVYKTGGPASGTYRTNEIISFGIDDGNGSGVSGFCVTWDNSAAPASPCAGGGGGSVALSDAGAPYVPHTLYVHGYDGVGHVTTVSLGTWTWAPNRAPVISCPGSQSVGEGTALAFDLSVYDPDGDAFTVNGLNMPPGSTLSGTHFTWTPAYNQVGNYNPTFVAADYEFSNSCGVPIQVWNVDRPPSVTCPATVAGSETVPLTVTVNVSDPDGDPIASLTASSMPAGATFTASAGNTIGTLSWTPGYQDAGNHAVVFTASNALSGLANCQLAIANLDRAPLVTAAVEASGSAGIVITIPVQAADPDGEAIHSLIADVSGLPADNNASLTPEPGNGSGIFRWTPALADTGTFEVTFSAVNALSGVTSTTISVSPSTLPPAPVLVAPSANEHVTASPTLVWDAMEAAISYRAVVSSDVGIEAPVWVASITAPDTSCVYNGPPLVLGAACYWTVQAQVAGGWSPLAVPRRVYRDAGTPPLSPPTALSPAAGTPVALPGRLSWDPVAGASVYRVQLRALPDGALVWTGMSAVPSLTLPGSIPGIGPGSALSWTVSSVDGSGTEGAPSAAETFNIIELQWPPGVATLVTPAQGATVTSQAVTFTWQPAVGATSYALTYSLSPDFPAASDSTWSIGALTRTYAILKLAPGFSTIYWTVTGANGAGPGPTSPVSSFTFDVQRLDITSVTLLRPIGHPLVPVGAIYSASVQVLGTWNGPIMGVWRVDNADWMPFTATMVTPRGVIIESPQLPTDQAGLHTIECTVTSPVASASSAGLFEVVNRIPGPPRALAAIVVPTSLEADGASQATATMSVLDSAGVLVSTDTGRPITQTITGPVTVVSSAGTTTNGQLISVLQAGTSPGTAEITYTADNLETILPTLPTGPQQTNVVYSGFDYPLDEYAKRITQIFNITNTGRRCGTTVPKIYRKHVAEDVGYRNAAGKLEVRAAGDGIVRYSREYGWCAGCEPGVESPSGGWGWIIVIEHDLPADDADGPRACTIYGHVDPASVLVHEGQPVKRGDPIAKVGHHDCWGDHLHFAVYAGGFKDIASAGCGSYPRFDDGGNGEFLTGYLCPAESPGRYRNPSAFIRMRPPKSAVVKVTVPVQNGLVTQKREEARYQLDLLAALGYETDALRQVVDNPGLSAEALTRIALAEQALLRIHHSSPRTCTRYCEEPLDVPGADVLVDDIGRSVQSLLGIGSGSLKVIRQVESNTKRVLGIVIKKKRSAEAIRSSKHAIINTADRFVNSQVMRIRDAEMRGRVQLVQGRIKRRLDEAIDSGSLLADVLSGDLFTAVAHTAIIEEDYIARRTQPQLNRIRCLAAGPYGNSQSDAVTQVKNQIWAAARGSSSAHIRYLQDSKCADEEARIAKYLDYIRNAMTFLGMEPLAALAGFAAKVPQWLGSIAVAEGLTYTAMEYPNMSNRARDAVSYAFGSTGGCPEAREPAAAPATARVIPSAPTRDLWRGLTMVAAGDAVTYEAAARSMAQAIASADTVTCDSLFDELVAAGNALDESSDLALSPYLAAGDEAQFLDAGFDSTVSGLTESASVSQMARAAYLLAIAAYLEAPSDSVVAGSALSAADAAINASGGTSNSITSELPRVFNTPAAPLLRLSGLEWPDSVAVGRYFLVRATCSNLGSGMAEGVVLRLQHDTNMQSEWPDSLTLPPLAPGDSVTIGWLLRPTDAVAFDSTGAGDASISVLSACVNGLGELREMPLTVHDTDPSAVGASGPPARQYMLQMGVTPNPSRGGAAQIWFTLPQKAPVSLDIFDVAGRRLSTLFRGDAPAGETSLRWSGRSRDGSKAGSGVYFARLQIGSKVLSRKLIVVQ